MFRLLLSALVFLGTVLVVIVIFCIGLVPGIVSGR